MYIEEEQKQEVKVQEKEDKKAENFIVVQGDDEIEEGFVKDAKRLK